MTTATQTNLSAIVNTESLRQIVDAAGSCVSGRTPKPVLACLRISTTQSGLEIHGTDLEKSVTAEASQVQIESAGSVLVDAKKFASG
jgi:DNA polymerase III sliding clamp (beta) subunit (PCNA family)